MSDDEMEMHDVAGEVPAANPATQVYNKIPYAPAELLAKLKSISGAARGKPGIWQHFKPVLASLKVGAPVQCHLECLHCGKLCAPTNPAFMSSPATG